MAKAVHDHLAAVEARVHEARVEAAEERSLRRLLLASPALGLLLLSGGPQDPEKKPKRADMPDLIGGLQAVEGCLGVDAGRMKSGKQVIFAWFEDKKAVLRWYRSKMHRSVMRKFSEKRDFRKPLEYVADDSGPIMVVASITMAEKPQFKGVSMPISQIAIELYQPLPGGTYLGERFTPMSVKVKGSRGYPK